MDDVSDSTSVDHTVDQDTASREFREKTLSGLNWSVLTQVVRQVLQFGIGVLLARLLTPEAYGLIGMVVVFTGFAGIFKDIGLGAALIQKQDAEPIHYTTVFWTNVLLGLCLSLLFIGLAPWISAFYDKPLLQPLTIFLAFNFLVDAFGIVQRMHLNKALDFRRLSFLEISTMLVSGTVAISLALFGYGVWSLAVQSVLGSLLSVLILWWMNDWRPSFRFSTDALGELWGFSSNLLGFSTLNYWIRNADNLLIGRFLGSGALGLYSKAYGLMLLPLRSISRTIGRVMFPAFSTIQHDPDRIARVYLRMTRTIALITFPMMLGLIAVSDAFVLGVFGPQWQEMIPVLQLLCGVGMIQSIGTLNGNLYQAMGRTDLQLRVGGTVGVTGVAAISIGIWVGDVIAVALAYTIFSAIVTYPSIHFAVSLVGLRVRDVAINLVGILGCATIMAGCVYLLGFALPPEWSHTLRLITQVFTGIVVYWGLVYGFGVQAYQETVDLLSEQIQRRRAA